METEEKHFDWLIFVKSDSVSRSFGKLLSKFVKFFQDLTGIDQIFSSENASKEQNNTTRTQCHFLAMFFFFMSVNHQ